MKDEVESGPKPFNRLTRLCEKMTDALEVAIEAEAAESPEVERSEVQTIVFLEDENGAGLQIHGYDDSMSAMVSLFVHMKAIFQANGKDLQFVAIPDSPEGVDAL